MKLITETQDFNDYLAASEIIDYENQSIQQLATQLSAGIKTDLELAQRVYEYVRDCIAHSCDIEGKVITCEASSVLQHQEGICFAKSHLLAALLRYLKIPSGFCYQRLILEDDNPSEFTLHGLNAIYLKSLNRWMRVDARGNKNGVNAQFNLEREMLAYPVREGLGEVDFPVIYAQPNPNAIAALRNNLTLAALIANLPSTLQ